MIEKITYTSRPDNCRDVVEFIGSVPECPVCGGRGEYESEYGPKACNPCSSRLIPFVDLHGKRNYVDWDETLVRTPIGLVIASEASRTKNLHPDFVMREVPQHGVGEFPVNKKTGEVCDCKMEWIAGGEILLCPVCGLDGT